MSNKKEERNACDNISTKYKEIKIMDCRPYTTNLRHLLSCLTWDLSWGLGFDGIGVEGEPWSE